MKLIQLNVEGDRHVERVLPFLIHERADIVCLEEVCEQDLPHIAGAVNMEWRYAPITKCPRSNATLDTKGVAILSRVRMSGHEVSHYFGGEGDVPLRDPSDRDSVWQPLLVAHLVDGGRQLTVGVTHFMKSWEGLPDDYQRARLPLLLSLLERYPELVLCGDFNIPRGTELYHALAARYRDCVPPTYDSSIDPILHRVPNLKLMIDYIWATPIHDVTEVRMVCGLSDHCAFVGELRTR